MIHNDNTDIGVSHRVVTRYVPQQLSTNGRKQVQVAVRTSIKEIITPYQVAKLMEADFSEKFDGKMLSQDDRKFIKIMQEGIRQRKDHHYEMPLPFRTIQPVRLQITECKHSINWSRQSEIHSIVDTMWSSCRTLWTVVLQKKYLWKSWRIPMFGTFRITECIIPENVRKTGWYLIAVPSIWERLSTILI